MPLNPKTLEGGFPWPGKGPHFADRFTPRRLGFGNLVLLDQQYAEVVNTGDPASIFVRLDQQYAEVVNSGDPATIFVRLDQQYLEIVCTFGTPPPTNGKKDDPPGKVRKQTTYLARRWREMAHRATVRGTRRYGSSSDSTIGYPIPAPFLACAGEMTRLRNFRRMISSGNDGHTVRMREG